MTIARTLFEKTLLHHIFREFQLRYRFKYVLPKVQEIELEGLTFDVSGLSTKVRNRLLNGAYESHEKQMCFDFLRPEDEVMEIGGAIGFIGLLCQKKIGIQEYSCFEANPRTCALLRRNYELNGVQPHVWNMALAGADGFADLEVDSDFWENSICYDVKNDAGVKTVRVPTGTLQTLWGMAGRRTRTNTLIIDVEGAEQFIDLSHIPESVAKIIIELHPRIIVPEITYNIVAGLIARGFKVARECEETFVFLRK
jgi:FkbM family methyltransferase